MPNGITTDDIRSCNTPRVVDYFTLNLHWKPCLFTITDLISDRGFEGKTLIIDNEQEHVQSKLFAINVTFNKFKQFH